MILPTSLLRVRVVEKGRRKVGLWIPLILIWPIVLALMAMLSPVAVLVCMAWRGGRGYILSGPWLIWMLWSMRGLEVRVKDNNGKTSVLVSFR